MPGTINDTQNKEGKERKGEILSIFEQLTGQKGICQIKITAMKFSIIMLCTKCYEKIEKRRH